MFPEAVRAAARAVALAVALLAAGCAPPDCGEEIDGEVPSPSLVASPLWAANEKQAQLLIAERNETPGRDLWLAVVPGTSEAWGHHRAPPKSVDADGLAISREFRARLDAAFRFLQVGKVRFILVSGGAVDLARPDYVEASRGAAYLVRTYGGEWSGPEPLGDRILVDTLALHTTTNIRNADKLSIDLGLNENLVVTTMPAASGLGASGLATQGFYLLEHGVSTFDGECESAFGYTLGDFELHEARDADGELLEGIDHCGFPVEALRKDDYGP